MKSKKAVLAGTLALVTVGLIVAAVGGIGFESATQPPAEIPTTGKTGSIPETERQPEPTTQTVADQTASKPKARDSGKAELVRAAFRNRRELLAGGDDEERPSAGSAPPEPAGVRDLQLEPQYITNVISKDSRNA